MKKTILAFCVLGFSLVGELYYLYNRNNYLTSQNSQMTTELESKNLILENGLISLEGIKKESATIKEELNKLLGNNKIEDIDQILNEKNLTSNTLQENIVTLESEIKTLEASASSLKAQYNTLLAKRNEEKVYIANVPTINQYPDYPTGCESVALTILLRYYGINVSPSDIINLLPKGSLPYSQNKTVYGGNPELEFVGNPYTQNSYGSTKNPSFPSPNSTNKE